MFGTRRAFTSREASKKNIAPDLLACHRTTTRNESLEHTGYTTERKKKFLRAKHALTQCSQSSIENEIQIK